MTRLRSLIVLGEYEDALKYFSNIPLKKLNVDERISFRKDIQEAILGKLQHLYSNEDYAESSHYPKKELMVTYRLKV